MNWLASNYLKIRQTKFELYSFQTSASAELEN